MIEVEIENTGIRISFGDVTSFEIAQFLQWVAKRHPRQRMVMDTHGLGKVHAEEFRDRYGLPIVSAAKRAG